MPLGPPAAEVGDPTDREVILPGVPQPHLPLHEVERALGQLGRNRRHTGNLRRQYHRLVCQFRFRNGSVHHPEFHRFVTGDRFTRPEELRSLPEPIFHGTTTTRRRNRRIESPGVTSRSLSDQNRSIWTRCVTYSPPRNRREHRSKPVVPVRDGPVRRSRTQSCRYGSGSQRVHPSRTVDGWPADHRHPDRYEPVASRSISSRGASTSRSTNRSSMVGEPIEQFQFRERVFRGRNIQTTGAHTV